MADSIINTFQGGLHQDSSFILQPDGTYRNLKNGMLISHDGNHFSLEISQGNKVLFELPNRYYSNSSDENTKDRYPMPIGFISFIDKLIVFHTNNETTTGGYGEIGMVSFRKVQNDFVASYTPLYHHQGLNFTKYNQIEGFAYRENENTQRVYWTDNLNQPRVIDVANPIFTTYIGPLDLVAGKTYMVLEGIIEHDDTVTLSYHGPSSDSNPALQAIPYVNSNIFVAVAGSSYTTVTPTAKVIEYYPIELLDWTPKRALGEIKFNEYGVGSKPYGSSMYFYRLTSSADGYSTTWSYGTTTIHIGGDNIAGALTGNAYRDFVGNGNDTTIINSGKSIKLTISNIDTNFDVIELGCIEYNQKTDVPYKVAIVAKENVTGTEMTLEDIGNTNFGDLTIEDLIFFPAAIEKVKTITTNKNYNVIANITEREEFSIDLSGVFLESFEYPMLEHDDPYFCTNGNIPEDVSPALISNPIATDIEPHTRWLVTSVSGGDIEYPAGSGDLYTLGEVFIGIVGSPNATIPVGSQCRPCTTRNRYINQNTNRRTEDAIQLKTGFWNYKDPAVASHNRGYWSNEKYRIGLMFYDKKGNPFYVKHLGDIDMPNITDKGGLMFSEPYASKYLYYLNPSGVKVRNLGLTQSIVDQISGFSIVRAERDKRIITQGLMMQNISQIYNGTAHYRPISTVIADVSDDGATNEVNGVYSFLCPDELVEFEYDSPIGAIGQKFEEAAWFIPYNFSSQDQSTSPMPSPHYHRLEAEFNGYSKLINVASEDAYSPREFEVGNLNGFGFVKVLEQQLINNIDGVGTYSNNASFINTAIYNILNDDTCSGSPLVGNKRVVGCKKIVFKADNVRHYNSIHDYGSVNEWQNIHKLLANVVSGKTPSSQYGGSGDFAIANTSYISTGHFQPITPQVLVDTETSPGIYLFDEIEVFGGDCFTSFVDIGYSLWDDSLVVGGTGPWSYALWFPCESNANYYLRRGVKVSNKDMYTNFGGGSNTDGLRFNGGSPAIILEGYSYNKGYSSEGDAIQYPALPYNYKFTGKFEYRTRWAGLKIPGELIDSFRVFRIPDLRDVDGNKGQINNVISKDSKTFYWQDHSVGYLPILERQLVGGGDAGTATALGVTGVIDRYEEIDTYFGNQHQHGLTETEFGFIWFDMRNRALCIMQTSGQIQEISLAKGLQVFFNNEFNEGNVSFVGDNDIYNTNNSYNNDTPLLGWGITGVYDPRFKMSYLTFKYKKQDVIDQEDEITTIESKDFTIGYNHTLNVIVGFYDDCPAIWHNHNDLVLSANDSKNYKYYGANMPDTNFVVGDYIKVNTAVTTDYLLEGEYVCIKDVNIPAFPPTSGKNPLTPGNVYWVKTSDQAEVYLKSFNTQYLKFYGIVRNFELELIVNPKSDFVMSYQNAQVKGMGPNFTDVYCYTDDQTASDINIPSTSIHYRWIDKAWFFNFPLSSRGRLTDYYLRVKNVFRGYETNPTTSKNTNKVVQWFKSFFIVKR